MECFLHIGLHMNVALHSQRQSQSQSQRETITVQLKTSLNFQNRTLPTDFQVEQEGNLQGNI